MKWHRWQRGNNVEPTRSVSFSSGVPLPLCQMRVRIFFVRLPQQQRQTNERPKKNIDANVNGQIEENATRLKAIAKAKSHITFKAHIHA